MANVANFAAENKGDAHAEMPDWMVEVSEADAGMGVGLLSELVNEHKAVRNSEADDGAEHPKSIQGDLHNLPTALAPLIALPHWVLWRWEKPKNKWTKTPYQPNGRKAKNNDPKTWNSYHTVIAALETGEFDGIGFCLLNGNIAAFDIDHCRDPNTGAIDPWATSLVQRTGSYSEITVSGTGLRIIGYGEGERLQRKLPVHDGVSIETYRRAERYIVVTGNPLPEAKDFINIDEQLDATVAELDTKKAKQQSKPEDGEHHARQNVEEEDWDKLERIIRNGEPHGDAHGEFGGDRNRAVWWVICEMFRRGYSARTIVSKILDRTNKISDHVYDQNNPRRYAEKQVRDARKKITFSNDEDGKLHKTQANIRIALLKMGVTLRYDQFADRTLIDGLQDFGPVLDDAACDRIWLLFDQWFKLHVSKELTRTVILDTALLNRFHPVRDYLNAQEWDGVSRIDTWLTTYGGVEDNEYSRAVGALFLTAAVRRARSPGCKFDEMVVLEQEVQGTDKSSALATLAVRDEWFSDDLPLNVEGKQVIEALRGRWIVEAGEMSGMKRTDIAHIKALLSRQVDRARLAYGRIVSEVPRQSVIVGTTNDLEYLRDATGNRRFWPVRCKRFDVEALRRDRDQLFG
jgi:Virulence-associated protein E